MDGSALANGRVVVSRKDDVVSRSVGGQRLLIPLRAKEADLGRVFTLNGTAAAAWDRFDGSLSVADLAVALGKEYGEATEAVLSDLSSLVQDLVRRGLVTVSEPGA